MYHFLCQKENGRVVDDFVLSTVNAVEFINWFYNEKLYDVKYIDISKTKFKNLRENMIPVGSIEFTEKFYKELCKIEGLSPVNVPVELYSYCQRKVWRGTENELITDLTFCKSDERLKEFTDVIKDTKGLKKGKYFFSELVDIDSEWRCFVLRGELLAIHNYNNSLGMYPDISKIKEMISHYTNKTAYTLDVGVNAKGTFVIEVHDFYSCGLYGFSDASKLLQMWLAGHKQRVVDFTK